MPQKHFQEKKNLEIRWIYSEKNGNILTKCSLPNSKFFAFWRNFAPKTTLLHLPNKIEKNKSPCSQRKGGNPSPSFGRHQQLVKAVRSSSLLHRLHLCACIGDLRRLVWQPFCFLDKCLRRCYEPMNAGAHTPMNSRFQKPMNHESCLLWASNNFVFTHVWAVEHRHWNFQRLELQASNWSAAASAALAVVRACCWFNSSQILLPCSPQWLPMWFRVDLQPKFGPWVTWARGFPELEGGSGLSCPFHGRWSIKPGSLPCTFHSINRHSSDLQLERQTSVNCSRIAREFLIVY